MIHLFVGTKAQFIKMVPIMKELQNRGIPYNYIDTGQHAELTIGLRRVFGVSAPDFTLAVNDKDITKIVSAVNWFLGNVTRACLNRKWLKNTVFPEKGVCLVHGDTLSTLLGTLMAAVAGVKVCHVEAGLRSYNWIDPFPEEIIRMICMRCSDILFAPSKEAFVNLKRLKLKGKSFLVHGNTGIDAIQIIKKKYIPRRKQHEEFALATCHRFETLSDRKKLDSVLNLFNTISKQMPVVFVAHKPTLKSIKKFELDRNLSRNILVKDMMDYPKFLTMMTMAEMVLTDGGSIQEECAFINKKCLILRNTTERNDGIGINAMLWKFNIQNSEKFLNWQPKILKEHNDWPSPSKEIVDHLIRMKTV